MLENLSSRLFPHARLRGRAIPLFIPAFIYRALVLVDE